MGAPLVVHISAGVLGLVAGFIALSVAKGGSLHKRSGIAFVYLMVVLGLTGAAIAAVELTRPVHKPALPATFLMGVFTAYLVVTALTAVRPPSVWGRRIDLVGMPVALMIGLAHLALAARALRMSGGAFDMVTTVGFIFGTIALIAAVSDFRILKSAPLTGAKRIARHLWRMTLALWVAALSFSPRLTRGLPKALHPYVMLPALGVLLALIYWMWRVRYRKSFRGLIGVAVPHTKG